MRCSRCGMELEKPGDFCLECRTANADGVVLDAARDRAEVVMLDEEAVVGRTTVTTTPEDGAETGVVELRNFAGRVADEIRRKRPEAVYAAGDRDVIQSVRAQSHFEFFRVDGDDPVEAAIGSRGETALETVDAAPLEKIGGSHSTLVGGRTGMRAIQTVAAYPHVKKVIPGPIDASGRGSQASITAKVTRADEHGNVRLLVRDGSSVQENRIVTTAGDRDTGERVRDDLNAALDDEELR
ncbi:DUF2103 domain-containing protein [Halorubellus sp. PRR65]|uniref:DUF2103 domain-containing protein n=1 Tax=Halorubellus sp. PRR65 TaxID=3098148 RepID=UPI002B2626B0|nr:DUF2103 domain-containing protein [Halorubellus sp. PRR65]